MGDRAIEREKIIDEAADLANEIKGYHKIIKDESLQRKIVGEELDEIVAKYGDDRRSEIMMGFDGDVTVEDLIPVEEMVVTLTAGG